MPAAAVTTVLERIERASLERRGGGLVVLLLAERAHSEGARSTRAIEDRPDHATFECKQASLEGIFPRVLAQHAAYESPR